MRTLDRRPTERVIRSLTAAAVLVAAVVMSGCNSAPAVQTAPQATYPEAMYLVATGTSPDSFEDAENRARTAIAAQIRSTLASQTTSDIRSDNVDGLESYESSTQQTMRQDTAFSHAELIHVDLASRREKGGNFHVVAYLKRSEAGPVLMRDYEAASAALRRDAGTVDAVAAGDLPGFAAAFGEARESWLLLSQRARELRAVAGRRPATFTQDRRRWDGIMARREQAMQDLRLSFDLLPVIPEGDRLDASYLTQTFTTVLTDLGLSVRGHACGEGEYLLELQPRLHYQGVIGVVCRLDFAGRLVECASGDSWDLQLEHDSFTGEGANTYKARYGAMEAVTVESVTPLLIEALRAMLPVD